MKPRALATAWRAQAEAAAHGGGDNDEARLSKLVHATLDAVHKLTGDDLAEVVRAVGELRYRGYRLSHALGRRLTAASVVGTLGRTPGAPEVDTRAVGVCLWSLARLGLFHHGHALRQRLLDETVISSMDEEDLENVLWALAVAGPVYDQAQQEAVVRAVMLRVQRLVDRLHPRAVAVAL